MSVIDSASRPGRYGRGTGHKVCSLCGEVGHQRNSPVHQDPALINDDGPTAAVTALRNGKIQHRTRTIPPRRLSSEPVRPASLTVINDDDRPKTRGDCKEGIRPCPYVSCSHHLYLDVNPETGAIKLNHPHLEVWEMAETCSLDLADRGAITLEEAGAQLGIVRERVRQIEERSILKLRRVAPELVEPGGATPELPSLEDRLGWR